MKFPYIKIATVMVLSVSQAYAINGVFDYGFGQINRGMGGAGVAKPQDAYATIINPAGIGVVDHKFDAGVAVYFPDMYSKWGAGTSAPLPPPPFAPLSAPAGTFDSKTHVFVMPDIGYLFHYNQQHHFGVSLDSIGGFGTKYRTHRVGTLFGVPAPDDGVLGNGTVISSLKIGSLNASYNYFFCPQLSFGLTGSFYVQAFKSAGAQGLAPFTQTALTGGVATKLSNNGTDYNHGFGATAGVLYRFNNHFSIAAAATPKVKMTKLDDYKDLLVHRGELDIPARYSAGVNISPRADLSLLIDVVKIMNKKVGTYGHNSRALFDGRCTPGTATPGDCVGGDNGPGFGWSNQTLLKVGAEYKYSPRDVFRLGFSYGNRIGHEEDIVINTLAPGSAARLITSAGYTRSMPCYKLNTFLTYIPSQTMSGVNELSVGAAQTVKVKVAGIGLGFGVSM